MKYLMLFWTICTQIIFSQNVNYKVNIKYEGILINASSQNQKEYLFRRPNLACIDGTDNIYVVDYQGTEVRKYNSEGKYIKTIGRVGQGPGEFVNISNISILDDKIIIRDSGKHQLIKYTTNGVYISTQDYSSKIANVYNQWCFSKELVLINKFTYSDNPQNMLFIYDGNNNLSTEFGHTSILFGNNDPIFMHQRHRVNLKVVNNNVFVVKKYYDGNIFKFDSKNNWAHTISGPGSDYYKKYEIESSVKPGGNSYNNVIQYYDDKTNKHIKILLRTLSAGLEVYDNKYLVNFIVSFNNYSEEGELGIEIYDLFGKYLGYCKINDKNILQKSINTLVFCMDNNSNFYILDREEGTGIEVIKKFKLVLK